MSTLLDGVELVDHHCHGVVRTELDRLAFEGLLTECDGPGPLHGSQFDTQIGMGIRAICAPLLELPRFAGVDEYLARRAELGADDVTRRMLSGTGITRYLVDTGLLPDQLTSPAELAAYTGAAGHEIVRLEAVAEQVIVTTTADGFAEAMRTELAERALTATGFKSVAAYRIGFDFDAQRPTDREVAAAAGRWLESLDPAERLRLVDPTMIRFLIWTALDLDRPLQFHVGYGDSDVDLHRCDPLLLTPLLRATAGLNVPVMLLHNYPFHRSAAYLAQVFDHVFVDVGLAMHNTGSRSGVILAELLELAPFGSVLFSSDAFGLAEIYAVNAAIFRRGLAAFLDDGIGQDFWSPADAERIALMIGSTNARRAYRLD
jgi:predicted TIM-barrel fold metal-dependent hydrolase